MSIEPRPTCIHIYIKQLLWFFSSAFDYTLLAYGLLPSCKPLFQVTLRGFVWFPSSTLPIDDHHRQINVTSPIQLNTLNR